MLMIAPQKIRYSSESVRGWTDLCSTCYEDYEKYYFNRDVKVSWLEHVEEFLDVYGIYPEDYGNWDEFYELYSDVFNDVAEVYFEEVLDYLRR